MDFWETVFASGLGAFFGFIAALGIFLSQEFLKNRRLERSTIENLKLEIEYNLNLYEKFETEINNAIEALSNDKKSIYLNLSYQFVGSYFAKQFYQNGLLLKYFHPEDMRKWNVMLNQVSGDADIHVNETVTTWRENGDIEKEDVYSILKHEKDQISYAKEMSVYIRNKL